MVTRRYRCSPDLTADLLTFDAAPLRIFVVPLVVATATPGDHMSDESLGDLPIDDWVDDTSALASALTWSGALVGAVLARKALTAAWTQVTGTTPPDNPAAPDATWGEALRWGALAGLIAGVSRVVARRVATRAAASLVGQDEARVA